MRCVILDDYRDVALAMADWASLGTRGNYRTCFTEAVEDVSAWLTREPVRLLP